MRSDDVIETIDGKAWWLYGTYQSERIAYDGKPHSFEVLRGGRPIEIQLGPPFAL
jgi:hypothetical protein